MRLRIRHKSKKWWNNFNFRGFSQEIRGKEGTRGLKQALKVQKKR